MTRPVYITLPALAWIAILAWISWQRAGEDRYAALRAEGLGLARLLSSAAVEASARLQDAEARLGQRLAASARRADDALRYQRGPASRILADIAREDRVFRIDWVAPGGALRASAQYPPRIQPAASSELGATAARRLADAEAVRAAEQLAPEAGKTVIEGMRRNAFGTRDRFGVALGREGGGTLLVRADAEELEDLRFRFGIAALLERMRQQPGVREVAVRSLPGGTAPPESTKIAGDVLRAQAGVALEGRPPLAIDVTLETASADEAVARTRHQILFWSVLASCLVAGAGLWLHVRDGRAKRREQALRQRAEDDRRLADMGALSALLAHEIGNPLNTIRFGLELMGRDPEAAAEERRKVIAEAQHMGEILERYMSLARPGAHPQEDVGPALLGDVRARTRTAAESSGVGVEVEVEPGAPAIRAEPVALEQALTNLVRNAIQAAPRGSTITLQWRQAGGGGTAIGILDRGPGFGPERAELFRLGTRGRPGGHGLGLPLARRFVTAAGGTLELQDRPGGGAQVVVEFPAPEVST